ncbi:hypothetical protein AcW1_003257 [Taiwanofungus camphoratus]|nr:hypothetical protein AcV5_001559 [Antrodia cinnamomea]KAI0942696.1 hypothetical protein AcW1_003257 [Antrodia cinnamomea]
MNSTGAHSGDLEVEIYNDKQYKRQLRGWLSYAFASEVFVIVSLTLFLPICLEQFARDNGYLLPDRTQPCTPTTDNLSTRANPEELRCVVKFGWLWIDSASFSLYVYSISVALQALTVISMGGIADHPSHRKRLLLTFAAFGAVSAMFFLLLPSSSPVWFLAAPLAIFANVGFGASVVALNAYLPALARGAREVVVARSTLWHLTDLHMGSDNTVIHPGDGAEDMNRDTQSAEEPLLPRFSPGDASNAELSATKTVYDTALSAATARISGQGIALGYAAGITMLLLALIPVSTLGGSTFALRLAIGLSGVWWALFSLPAAVWLPGSSSAVATASLMGEDVSTGESPATKWSPWREIKNAWRRLGGMLRWQEIKKLRNTFVYLAAWFVLSDGFTTITSTAILFGKTTLHMSPFSLVLIGALTPSAGILGSLTWPAIQRRMQWSNLRVLVVLVALASAIPAYGCLGFLPVFQHSVRFGGLTTQGEMFVLAVYFGAVYGAFQGYARAFYAELIPPGEEARWYGLFSITDKVCIAYRLCYRSTATYSILYFAQSSSFVGPLVVGLIADTTGNIRYAFFFLVFMIWLGIPILMSVDVERGREDARKYTYRMSC